MNNPCENCVYAKWDRTKSGALHPNGNGRCTWTSGDFVIPKSMEYNVRSNIRLPLRGGLIGRGVKYISNISPCDAQKPK